MGHYVGQHRDNWADLCIHLKWCETDMPPFGPSFHSNRLSEQKVDRNLVDEQYWMSTHGLLMSLISYWGMRRGDGKATAESALLGILKRAIAPGELLGIINQRKWACADADDENRLKLAVLRP